MKPIMTKKVITIVVLQATMLYYLVSAGGCLRGGHGQNSADTDPRVAMQGQDRPVPIPQIAELVRNVAVGAQLLIEQSQQVIEISKTAQKLADLQAVSKLRCLNPLKICKHAEGNVRSHNDMEAVPALLKAQRLFTAANVVKEEAEGVGEVCTQLMKADLTLIVREAENAEELADLHAESARNLDSLRSISQQLANLQVAHIANVHSLQDFVKERSAQGGEIDWRLFESRQLADLQSQHELNADSLHSFDEQLANLQVEHERRIAQLGRVKGDINRRLAYASIPDTQQLANLQLEHETRISELHQAVANSAGPSAWGNTQGSRSPDLSVAVCIVCTTLLTVIRMNSCPDGYTGA
ncbi:hypothetical protein SeLEV6574_g05321 [Synchytrium endobioticum]|uniref:Uncharacterized protein n=1 Tax=Synchytrium endobioticum TaxID=286115 RepID=A0A507CUV8_9FUNG|nr:hypothetical protein SeLEV6574_g05321 [Synchytrium endobioticum]